MTDDITEEALLKRYSSMESEQLVKLLEQGDRTEMAMGAIEHVLAERGVNLPDRSVVERQKAAMSKQNQSELDRLAPLEHRLGAQIIDSIIAFGLLVPLAVFVHVFVGLAAFLLYSLFQDALPNGQSLGKRILRIAVVDKVSGEACGFVDSFLRNIILLILGIFDLLFLMSESRQRLGDKAARTIVVRVNKS